MDPQILRDLVMKHEQMVTLLNDIKDTIRMECTRQQYEEAKAYWLGHIGASLGGTDYVDDHSTMLKLLKQLGYDEDTDSVPGEDGNEDDEDECEKCEGNSHTCPFAGCSVCDEDPQYQICNCDEHVALRKRNAAEDAEKLKE